MADPVTAGAEDQGARLRVLSYNVHGQRDDVAALAAAVRAAAPDVVIVQEGPRRFGWRQRGAALAQRLGLVVGAGGLPSLGNLVLTSLRVRAHRTWCHRYPLTPGRHMRGAAFAECSVGPLDLTSAPVGPGDLTAAPVGPLDLTSAPVGPGDLTAAPVGPLDLTSAPVGAGDRAALPAGAGAARFVVVGSHLATDPVERPAQAADLKRQLAAVKLPLIVGADLNDQPDGAAWRTVADGLVDTAVAAGCDDRLTYPCADPRRRIDGIFVDPRIIVASYDVVDTPQTRRASDHFPVLADLILPANP